MGRIIWTGLVEVIALLIAAAVGAWLQARQTERITLELHRTERKQGALLQWLDLLSQVQLAIEKCLSHHDMWVPAAEGIGAPMVRDFPDLGTWELSGTPNDELVQWSRAVVRIYETERAWRDRLRARVAEDRFDERWNVVSRAGFHLAYAGADPRAAAERIRTNVAVLMNDVREIA